MRWMGLSVVFALACNGGGDDGKDDGNTTAGDADTDADTDADSDADTDADSDADTDTDTDADTDSGLTTDTAIDDITNMSFEVHPTYGSLVTVSWDQGIAGDAHVEFSFDKGEWHSSPTISAVQGTNEQLIVGIPYGMTAEWRVVTDTLSVDAANSLVTDPVPPGLLEPTIRVSEPADWLPEGNYILSSVNVENQGWTGGTYWTWIMDREGRYVWASKAPQSHWTLYASVARSGDHILWDEATAWSDFGSEGVDSTVHRTYLDEEIEEIPTPGLHHAFWEHLDGTLAWGSLWHANTEALVEQAPGAKTATEIWNCGDDWPGVNSCESNCVFYDPGRDAYLYSFYTNNTMAEVSRSTGETLWWAGAHPGGYEFIPPDKRFSWQHGVTWTDAGTLLVSSEVPDGGGPFSYTTKLYEYIVDHKARTLTLIWEYDPGVHAATNGDARRLANGNTFAAIGSAGQIHEVDQYGNQVWVMTFPGNYLVGRAELIDDLYDLVSP